MATHTRNTAVFAIPLVITAMTPGIISNINMAMIIIAAITTMGIACTITVAWMTIMVTAIGAATGTTGATGKDNMETTMDSVATITAMNGVTTTLTGVRSSRVSVILSRLARCVPLPGHTGNVFNHPHETVLPIDQQKNRQLESFFIDWEERAFYLAYAALWDRESALDAVQEAMTRLVEYYRDKPAEEWPALFRTILNSKINDIRRRRMIEQGKHKLVSLTGLFQKDKDTPGANMEYELPADGREDGITSPEAELVAGELRSRVTDALQSLSERQRQVFILREWRGMTIRETAQTLGCSENSVKQHHFRALRTLRVQLAEVWNHAQAATS